MGKRTYTPEQLEHKREHAKLYYEQNRDRIKANVRRYAQDNKDKVREYQKEWKARNRQKVVQHRTREYEKYLSDDEKRRNLNLKHLNHYHAIRAMIFDRLGSICTRCGFEDKRALQIDHINGGGGQHRRNKTSLSYFLEILNDSELISKYQILCANCNWIKRAENNENRRLV